MNYRPADVIWEVLPAARKVHDDLHAHLPADRARESVDGLRELLCNYFSAAEACDKKSVGISPNGRARGGRAFKVRWKIPGLGKSCGLRLAIIAMCPEKRIVVAGAWARDTDPQDSEFDDAFNSVRTQ
jgi:hypothetical protein